MILLRELIVSLFAGCGEQKYTDSVYSIHVDYEGEAYEFVILAVDGQIFSVNMVEK